MSWIHIVDLYQVYISGWHTGREETFKVYGPSGITEYFEGVLNVMNRLMKLIKAMLFMKNHQI